MDGRVDGSMDDISGSSRMHLLVFTLLQCVKMTLVKWYNIYREGQRSWKMFWFKFTVEGVISKEV